VAVTETLPAVEPDATDSAITFEVFLEATPPGVQAFVANFRETRDGAWRLATPDIQLHCGSPQCGGPRYFSHRGSTVQFGGQTLNVFLPYACRNCNLTQKIFAICLDHDGSERSGLALKYGEWPVFGPPTSSRLLAMLGSDGDTFLKGRRAESQSLGIGAHTYYRRVVENQKNRLIDEILKVVDRSRPQQQTLEALAAAKKESQFSKAVDLLKNAIPPALLIDGHSPLGLLRTALIEGANAKTDEDCLEMAMSVRVILQEFAERTDAALKDQGELRSALSRLLDRQPGP
jgi:hypothetical protein